MIGQEVSHYRVTARLGGGGMGEVFRAEDLRLGRTVALKFLPRSFCTESLARERFVREARAASSLDHPNICIVHEIDETPDGQLFIAMANYDGETLRDRIARGPLEPTEAAQIAAALAAGLACAHEAGIVHRDVKPANVMLTRRGEVKILDFGLAKLSAQEGPTAAGTTLGTAHYMSPEQALGTPVDARSDLWSLGVVLYQMLTGRLPFDGDSLVAVVAAIVGQEPPPLRSACPGVPLELDRVVARALVKERDERYQRADELAADLNGYLSAVGVRSGGCVSALGSAPTVVTDPAWKRVSAPSPPRRRGWWRTTAVATAVVALAALGWWGATSLRTPSAAGDRRLMVVVMPFDNLGPAEDGYFAAGVSDEITSSLTGLRELGVISRTSAAAFRGTGQTARQIGRELGVDFVLQGSVRWDRGEVGRGRVRITPRLVRVADDTEVWSSSYDRVIDDIFAVQTDIAQQVAGAMDVALGRAGDGVWAPRPPASVEAYELYLRGLDAVRAPPTAESSVAAVSALERAVRLDPDFAPAWAALARAHARAHYMGFDRSPARAARAREAAETATRVAPGSAEAHLALGYVLYWVDRDLRRALEEMQAAERLRPGDSEVLSGTGLVLRRQGRYPEALDRLERAFRLSPREARLAFAVSDTLASMRNYVEAMEWSDRGLELAPATSSAHLNRAIMSLSWRGDLDRAEAELDLAGTASGGSVAFLRFTLHLYRREAARGLEALRHLPVESLEMVELRLPRALLEGVLLRLDGDDEGASVAFETARSLISAALEVEPDDARLHSALGLALAGLDRREEALEAGQRGVELCPRDTDALLGPFRVYDLALIAATVGERDLALASLADVLSNPGEHSGWDLRLDPRFDGLRDDPRFERLAPSRQ